MKQSDSNTTPSIKSTSIKYDKTSKFPVWEAQFKLHQESKGKLEKQKIKIYIQYGKGEPELCAMTNADGKIKVRIALSRAYLEEGMCGCWFQPCLLYTSPSPRDRG